MSPQPPASTSDTTSAGTQPMTVALPAAITTTTAEAGAPARTAAEPSGIVLDVRRPPEEVIAAALAWLGEGD